VKTFGKARPEPGDLLCALFTLVLVRQFFWLLPNGAAWVFTVALTGLLVLLPYGTRTRIRPPLPRIFWLGVALPVALLWATRVPRPDWGWDVLNYHLLHGERAFRGLLAIPGDFYPYYFPFLNPAPDTVATLLRHALGYRLGTVGSCLALVWTAALLFRLLERPVRSVPLRAGATLWIVITEGALCQLGNYMVDLFGIPLLLEALILALPDEDEPVDLPSRAPAMGLLLGMAVAFKLTNLPFAIMIVLAALATMWKEGWPWRPAGRSLRAVALGGVLFVLPLVPHTLLLWWTTGSPVFPHYNALFQSPLFPPFNVRDGRFGPETAWEALAWPVLSAFHPARLSELGWASGRMAMGFLASVGALLFLFRGRRLPGLAAVVVGGGFLWGLGTGYCRYGIFLEVLGGAVFVILAVEALSRVPKRYAVPIATVGGLALAMHGGWILWNVDQGDWSGRPTAFHDPREAIRELTRLGNDRKLAEGIPPDIRPLFERVEGWVDVAPKTNGIMALLAPDLPVLDFILAPLLEAPANRLRYNEALEVLAGKQLASLAASRDAAAARAQLKELRFRIRTETAFSLPFFSPSNDLHLVAFFVEAPPPEPNASGRTTGSRLTAREMLLRRPPRG
jgi:hypothetical protein